MLALGIACVVLSSLGAVAPALGVVGAVIAILVLIYQHRTTGAVVVPFTPADWKETTDGYVLDVPKKRHGKKAPSVTVWWPTEDGRYEEVICGVETNRAGDVRVEMGRVPPCSGELRIS